MTVTDDITHRRFLVDTGAQVSVLPATSPSHLWSRNARPPPLQAANGSVIWTYGYATSVLSLAGRQYHARFVIASVQRP